MESGSSPPWLTAGLTGEGNCVIIVETFVSAERRRNLCPGDGERPGSTVEARRRQERALPVHELSITQSLVDAVSEQTVGAQVLAVNLQVGRLSGVVPDAMRFCFELVTEGTPLQGARLEIAEPDGRANCRGCGDEFDLPDLLLLCPCGSADVELLTGRELCLMSVEVAAHV